MDEHLEELTEDLKGSLRRAEHSYYVSLKYTRTVDVIRNLIDRIINSVEEISTVLLHYNKEKKVISEIPENWVERINILREIYPEDELLNEAFEEFFFLRKVRRQEYEKTEEFRRHVTMHVSLDGEKLEFNIDILGEYYARLEKWVKHTLDIALERPKEEL